MTDFNAAAELKGLQTQLAKSIANKEILQNDVKLKQKELAELTDKINGMQTRIAEITSDEKEPVISEHAILRYLERIKGLDITAIKDEILDEKTIANIKFIKRNGKIKRDAFNLVVKDNIVVSIY
jgi:hypothetical protein